MKTQAVNAEPEETNAAGPCAFSRRTSIQLINSFGHLIGNCMMIANHAAVVVSRSVIVAHTVGGGVDLQAKIWRGMSSGRVHTKDPHANTTKLRMILNYQRLERNYGCWQPIRIAK